MFKFTTKNYKYYLETQIAREQNLRQNNSEHFQGQHKNNINREKVTKIKVKQNKQL